MLPVKIYKDKIYILNAYVGVPPNLKLGVSVNANVCRCGCSLPIYTCMWIKQLSLHIRLNIFLNTNKQSRQQNKLVNMVNGNDLIKQKYWPYICI